MFEKEAEEYAENTIENWNYRFSDEIEHKVKQIWKNGAEFGYNKANEWQYPSKGEYPKECACCLLYLGDNVNPITGWRHRGVWYFEDDRDLETWQDEVKAWKEIVLPKESK